MNCFVTLLFSLFISLQCFAQFGEKTLISGEFNRPLELLTIDVDEDGDLDVLGISDIADQIVWLENDGQGLFLKSHSLNGFFNMAENLMLVDVDDDGDEDLIFSNSGERNSVTEIVWFERVPGGFGALRETNFNLPRVHSFGLGDVDGDGVKDLVVAHRNDTLISMVKGLPNGDFLSTYDTVRFDADSPDKILLSDFDGDNAPDIIYAGYNTDSLYLLRNMNGEFPNSESIDRLRSLDFFSSEDIDDDGDDDIVCSWVDGYVSTSKAGVLLNDGVGNFQNKQVFFGTDGRMGKGILYDQNMDGFKDLIFTTSYAKDSLFLLMNSGVGVFDSVPNYLGFVDDGWSITVGDINDDSIADIITGSLTYSEVKVLKGMGGVAYDTAYAISSSSQQAFFFDLGDMDNDGDMDVVSVESELDEIGLFENVGAGVFKPKQLLADSMGSPIVSLFMDLDFDGDSDIVVASINTDQDIQWFENNGNGMSSKKALIDAANISCSKFLPKDLDEDGLVDFVVWGRKGSSNGIGWFKNNGGLSYDSLTFLVLTSSSSKEDFEIADVNNDGHLDFITASGKIDWFEGQGGGSFGAGQYFVSSFDPSFIAVGDVDGNGVLNVVASDHVNDQVSWFEFDTVGGEWIEHPITISFTDPLEVSLHDVDDDNDLDIILNAIEGEFVLLNNSQGGFTTEILFDQMGSCRKFLMHDFDGDNKDDLVACSFSSDKIYWYKNYFGAKSTISGYTFYDVNQNQFYDSSDYPLSNIQIQLSPDNVGGFSTNGLYTISYDTGTYNISTTHIENWHFTTDSVYESIDASTPGMEIDSLSFGFFPDSLFDALETFIIQGQTRCSEISNLTIALKNQGTAVNSGVLEVLLDSSVTIINMTVPFDSVVGNSRFWHFSNLLPQQTLNHSLEIEMPDFQSVGDTIAFKSVVYLLDSLGSLSYHSTNDFGNELTCAYDPNDKQALHPELGENAYVGGYQNLKYLIRFQNTGNDLARNVSIKDSLSSYLKRNTVQLISSSHPVELVFDEQQLWFNFDNIMLPDSGTDYTGSMGYVLFQVSMIEGVTHGDVVLNEAEIYFDYNSAVITNAVQNTVYVCSGIETELLTPKCLGDTVFAWVENQYPFNHHSWIINGEELIGDSVFWVPDSDVGDIVLFMEENSICSVDTEIVIDYSFPILDTSYIFTNGTFVSNSSDTIKWIDCSSGAVASTDSVFTPIDEGYYALVSERSGCSDTTNCVYAMPLKSNGSLLRNVNVFPNPVLKEVIIDLAEAKGIAEVCVLDNLGRTISCEEIWNKQIIKLEVDELKSGMYYISLRNTNEVQYFKILKL